jgi:hypothetical protein
MEFSPHPLLFHPLPNHPILEHAQVQQPQKQQTIETMFLVAKGTKDFVPNFSRHLQNLTCSLFLLCMGF